MARPAPGGDEHPRSHVETDHPNATRGQVAAHLARSTTDIEHRTPTNEPLGNGIEHGAVHREPLEIIRELRRVVVGDGVVRGTHHLRGKWLHGRQSGRTASVTSTQFR